MTRVRSLDALVQANRERALRAKPRKNLHGRDGVSAIRARRRVARRRDGWKVRLARLALVAAVGAFFYGLWHQPVRDVDVRGAVLHDDAVLEALAAPLHGQRWLTLETEAVVAAMEDLAWIRDVRVTRVLPDGVRIDVVESHPIARVVRDDQVWGVGDDGRAATLPAHVHSDGLPQVEGLFDDEGFVDPEAARRLQSLVDALRDGGWPFAAGLEHILLDDGEGLALRTGDDVLIRLGRRDTAEQIRTAAVAWSHLAPGPGDRLDLRFARQAVLTRAGG